MGIEFRLGRTDHRVVEDFLADKPSGVSAIVLEASNLKFQREAAEAAVSAGIDVFVDPLTDRLVAEGFSGKGLNYADKYPIKLSSLQKLAAQAELVERVLATEDEQSTVLTPPYFYAESTELVDLNVSLAGLASQVARRAHKRVRPVLAAPRVLLADREVCEQLAQDYRRAGVDQIELRLSPLGGENDGARKVSSALDIVAWITLKGLKVTLGLQGNIGQTALALGLADSYSTGIGFREHFNHSSAVNHQRRAATLGKSSFGATAGVFLPAAGVTVRRAIAGELYADKGIRSRLACSIASCSRSIDGPVNDPRGHYLHSRAALVDTTLGYPERWRAAQEQDRLERAIEFREMLNRDYLAPPQHLKTRTARALAGEIQRRIEQSKTA